MAFWGIQVKADKPVTHCFDKARGRLHISQATRDSFYRAHIQCYVGDNKSPIHLCGFSESSEDLSLPLDLEFAEEDNVVFEVLGRGSVYLTGFYRENIDRCGDDRNGESKMNKTSKGHGSGQNANADYEVKKGPILEVADKETDEVPNGMFIEEVEMGKASGKRATPGTNVSVHYIGQLKTNGRIFSSTLGKAPYKFLLGEEEVIKGWEIGVYGMRIGDKRRLTIPPSMGYGSKGLGGKVPPNAWLVFEVELVDDLWRVWQKPWPKNLSPNQLPH